MMPAAIGAYTLATTAISRWTSRRSGSKQRCTRQWHALSNAALLTQVLSAQTHFRKPRRCVMSRRDKKEKLEKGKEARPQSPMKPPTGGPGVYHDARLVVPPPLAH